MLTIYGKLSFLSYAMTAVIWYIALQTPVGSQSESVLSWVGGGFIVLGAILAFHQNTLAEKMPYGPKGELTEEGCDRLQKMIDDYRERMSLRGL